MKTTSRRLASALAILFVALASSFSAKGFAQTESGASASQPAPLVGKIESLGAFKNGVCVVEQRFDVPSSGRYSADFPPSPLHGAFFIQSDAVVSATTANVETSIPISEAGALDWTKDFQGQWLKITLPGETEAQKVRVLSAANASTSAETIRAAQLGLVSNPPNSDSVLLERESGETLWLANPGAVTSVVLTEKTPETVSRQKPRIFFDVNVAPEKKGATIRLFYLSRGLCWAPQYRVEILDGKKLEIERSAILINEWGDFEDVPVTLYSGFPQIALSSSTSPMDPTIALQSFFTSLNGASLGNLQRRDSALMTQAAFSNSIGAMGGIDLAADLSAASTASEGDGIDVFGQSVGVKTLKKGERQMFSIGRASTDYEPIVCWNIMDARDANGRFRGIQNATQEIRNDRYGQTTSGEYSLEYSNRFPEPWDAVSFANPFESPITTGPASAIKGSRFLGQNSLFWTNPNEKTLLPITKALSVRVSSIENERFFEPLDPRAAQQALIQSQQRQERKTYLDIAREDWGKQVVVYGRAYRVAVVDAQITLKNQRSEAAKVRLSRQYSGVVDPESLEGFDEIPETKRLGPVSGGPNAANPRTELRADVSLQPGETRVLKFAYQVLVML